MPRLTPEQRRLHATIATRTRWAPDAPADIDDLRRDLRVSLLEGHIREVVDSAPPPTPEQVERLRALLPHETGGAA